MIDIWRKCIGGVRDEYFAWRLYRSFLRDGNVMSGTVERIESDHLVLDEDSVFGDWVFILYANIIDIKIK